MSWHSEPLPDWSLSLVALLGACTLQEVEQAPCQGGDVECRTLYGLGSVCQKDGFCSVRQPPHERCQETYPGTLFDATPDNAHIVVFGSLFNHDNPDQLTRKDAAQLALQVINEQDGLPAPRFGLISCNVGPLESKPQDTEQAALESAIYLTEQLNLPALIGPASSGDVQTVFANVAKLYDVFVGSPSATGEVLTRIDNTEPTDENPGLLWRTVPPDLEQGAAIARDMSARGKPRVAVIRQSGAYGEGLYAGFASAYLEATNGDSAALGRLDTFDNRDHLRAAIEAAGNDSEAQEVLFITSDRDDVITFLTAAAEHPGLADKNLFLTDTAGTQNLLSQIPAALFGRIRGTWHYVDKVRPVYKDFLSNFERVRARDASMYSFTAHAYDMAWIAALGAGWAMSQETPLPITGSNIAKGARFLSEGVQTDLVGSEWTAALNAFSQGDRIDVEGASGPLDYDPLTEETTGTIEVGTIDTSTSPPQIVPAPPLPPPVE